MKTQSLKRKLFCALAATSLLPAFSTQAANIVQDANANFIAWEAESNVTINNSGAATFAVISDANASGGQAIQGQGARNTPDGASSASWTLVFNTPGTYQLYIKYMLDPCCGANSYLFPAVFGGPFPGGDANWKVSSVNENGAGATAYTVVKEREQNQTAVFATFTVNPGDIGNPLTFAIGTREVPGIRIDRIVLSLDTTLNTVAGAGFDSLPNSGGPLSFAVQPADASDLTAGQTATFSPQVVGGTGPYTYKWYTNGILDAAAVLSSYSIVGVAQGDSGRTVQAVATDATSTSATSRVARLTVVDLAGSVGANFSGRFDNGMGCCSPEPGLAPGDMAGVVALGNWNNIDVSQTYAGTSGALNNANGSATTVTLNYAANDSWNNDAASAATPNEIMMRGISKANGADGTRNTYTFQNLPVGDYDLLAYMNVNGDTRLADVSAGGKTIYFQSQHTFGGTFIQVANTISRDNPVGPRDFGNFAKFTGLTPDTSGNIALGFVNRVTATGGNADGIGMAGIQLLRVGVTPVTITSQPADTTVGQGSPFSFTVGVSGSGPLHIQWYEGSTAIAGANALTYTATALSSQNGHHFHVTVSNDVPSGAVSADAVLTVANVPVLLASGTLDSLTNIYLRWSKPMDATVAGNTSHYSVNKGISVLSAALAASDPSVVIVTTSPMTNGVAYTITITGLTDTDVPSHTTFPNPTSTTVTPSGYEPVRLTYEQYRALNSANSQNISVLTSSPKYPNNPDFVEYNGNNALAAPGPRMMEYPQTAAAWVSYGNLDDFGARYRGYYVAPLSGNYIFAIASDDHGELWLSTDANPATKVKIASVPDWTNERNYITRSDAAAVNAVSGPITLTAGNVYYMEALMKEGGGGDHVGVAVQRPGDPAIANGQLGIPLDQFAPDPGYAGRVYYVAGKQLFTPGPVTITFQPTDQHVVEGSSVSFSVDYTGTPPTTVQWYEVSNTATNPVPGGTGKTLTVTAAIANNGHKFRAVVQNVCSTATSRDALLTVDVDVTKPTVADAGCDPADKTIRVQFSETVLGGGGANAADNAANYVIDGGLSINAATILADNKTVLLVASDFLTPDALYNLSISNIKDRSVTGNTLDATNVPIKGCICTNGVLLAQMFRADSGGNNFNTVTNNPKWPNNPDIVAFLSTANWAQTPNTVWTNGNEENYALRMKGYIIAPSSGNYTFYEHADDSAQLLLSTDSSAANLRQIIYAAGDCGACTERASGLVNLTAGRAYYFEAIFQEGGGGDYLEVRWLPPGGAKDFIGAANLRYCFDPLKVPFIVDGPHDLTVTECRDAVFSVNVTAPDQGVISYQWSRDGNPVSGANGPTYTIPNANLDPTPTGDNGAVMSVHVSVGLRASDSSATLTVLPDTAPPVLLSAVGDETMHRAWLTFSETLQPSGATDPSQYSIVGSDNSSPVIIDAQLVEGSNVVLTVDTPLTEGLDYTVTVVGNEISDECVRNQVDPGSAVHFRAWLFVPCLATAQIYDLASLGAVQAVSSLTGSPLYPRHPRETHYIGGVDSRLYYPDDSHDMYGGRIWGYLNPPVEADYIFWRNNDDDMSLRLNSNPADSENPAGAVEVLAGPCCNADRPFTQASGAVHLVPGSRYYFEALYKEGIGGDYLEIAASISGQPAPSSPLGPDYIGTRVNPDILSSIMPTLPTSGKLPLGTLGARGFDVRIVQVTNSFTNTLLQTEAALAGTQGPNVAGVPRFLESGVINYNIPGQPSTGTLQPDALFPGIPGASPTPTDNIALEALTYIELHQGIHCMIVNSDDGFRVTPACGASDPNNSIVLGFFDGGRGSSDSGFVFNVPSDGLYPFRLIWEQGGGGANLEWVDIQPGNPNLASATPYRYGVNGNNNIKAFSPTAISLSFSGGNVTVAWTAGTGAPCHNWKLQSTGQLMNNPAATVWTTINTPSPVSLPVGPNQAFFRLIDAP